MDVRTVKDLQDKIQAEELLFSLIEKNDTENFKILLDKVEPKPNIELQKDSKTPLIKAAIKGNASIVKILIDAKANIDAKDAQDETALSWAAYQGHEDVVIALLEAKAELEPKNKEDSRTPLFYAVFKKHSNLVKVLLDAKADCEVKDKYNLTPLFTADFISAKMLLDAKANVNHTAHNNHTALMDAAKNKKSDVVRLLLEEKANTDIQDDMQGATALMTAACHGCPDSIKALLAAKANVTIEDKSGKTALDYASGTCLKLIETAYKTPRLSWFNRLFDNSRRPQGYSEVKDQELSQLRS